MRQLRLIFVAAGFVVALIASWWVLKLSLYLLPLGCAGLVAVMIWNRTKSWGIQNEAAASESIEKK